MKLYDNIKDAKKKDFRNRCNLDFLKLTLMSMFEYQNLPSSIPKRFIESYLIEQGTVGVGKIGSEIYVCKASPCGEVDAYGVGTRLTGATPIGEINGKIGLDVVLGINNSLMRGDYILSWYAHLISEIDLSMDANIINARLHPTPVAKNSKSKSVIDTVLNNMRNGKLESVVSDNVISEWSDSYDIPMLSLTNISNIEKIQYLSRFYDDTMKRFYNQYGHALQTQNKSAQQTTDEIHGMDSTSLVIPLDRLKCRKEMVSNINKLFGTNITVDFSPTWKLNFERFIKDNASTDTSTDTSTDSSTDSSTDTSTDTNTK